RAKGLPSPLGIQHPASVNWNLTSGIWNLTSGIPRSPTSLHLSLLDRIPNKREFLARSIGSLGILRLMEGIAAARPPALVVFTYHRIAVPGIDSDDYYDPVISATPEAFRAQVA